MNFLCLHFSQPEFQALTLQTEDGKEDGQILSSTGQCFIDETECR